MGDRQVATLRRRLLIRTLEENPSLGNAAMSVSTGLTPLNDVTRLLQACPQMQHLRWQVVNVPLEPLNTDWYLSSKLPSLSATLTSFALHQQVSSPYWPESLDKAIKDADNIRNISLYTPPGPAKVVLSALGSQLSSLSIWVWGQDHGHMPTGELQSLLAAVPKLASLRLYTIRPHQLEELHFLSELRKLSFDQVLHGVVDEVMRLIATNPSWCPNLSRFPHFNRVSDASYYFTKKGRAKWQTLKNKSRLVKMYAARDRPAWRVDGSEIDHLMNRLTRNGDGEGETPVPWSQLGPQHTRWYGAKKPKSPSC